MFSLIAYFDTLCSIHRKFTFNFHTVLVISGKCTQRHVAHSVIAQGTPVPSQGLQFSEKIAGLKRIVDVVTAARFPHCINLPNHTIIFYGSNHLNQIHHDSIHGKHFAMRTIENAQPSKSVSIYISICKQIHLTVMPLNYAWHAFKSLKLWSHTLMFGLMEKLWLLMGLVAWLMSVVYRICNTFEDPSQ